MTIEIVSTRVLHQYNNIQYVERQIRLENGETLLRSCVLHPGAVAILPILDDGRVLLIEQYRLTLDKTILEIPAGTLEIDEDPGYCAERELQEEAGYFPQKLSLIGQFYPAPGILNEAMFLYLAEDLRPSRLAGDVDEVIKVMPMALDEALAAVADGRIRDMKTVLGLWHLAGRG